MKLLSEASILKHTQTVGEINEIDKTMKLVLFIQSLFGHQILDPTWTWRRYIWNQLFTIFIVIYAILGTLEVLSQIIDIKLIAEAYYTLIVTCVFVIKYLMFVVQRRTFQKLYVVAKTDLYDLIKENSEDKGRAVLDKGKLVLKLLCIVVSSPVAMYLLKALFYYAIGERVTLSKTTSILMPMTSPFYEIGLILHTIFMIEVAFSILVIDMWFVFLMFIFCTASDSLVKILHVEKRYYETDRMYRKRLNYVLKKFHKAHLKQTMYLSILSEMYKWPSMVPLLQVFLFTCLLLLLMSEGFDVTFASNILANIGQIFAYNWFGEQIKMKTANTKMALLDFEWTNMNVKDMKNYYIIITYMNKEFGIKTAMGNYLSLLTMTSVFKASYQAYAVLSTVKD